MTEFNEYDAELAAHEYMRDHYDVWIEEILGDILEDYQKTVCSLIVKHDRLNVKACHAVGKTFLLGRVGLAFLYLYAGSKIITTAPTYRQVEKLLWGEIRAAKKRSLVPLDGKQNLTEIKIDDDWFMMGFSPKVGAASDNGEQNDSSFQGFHAKYILIIFDEATGISKDVYTMAEGLVTSGKIVKWVCIANPTSRGSQFFKNCKKADWYTHTINCFDSPNMKANGFNNKQDVADEIAHLRTLNDEGRLERIKNYDKPNHYLLSAQWAMARFFEWGFEHPLSKSKILGEFPDTSDDTIIDYASLSTAFDREVEIQPEDKRYIGVDVARFGDDTTVITELIGSKWVSWHKMGKMRNTEVAGAVIAMVKEFTDYRPTHIQVDATGVGSGVMDILHEHFNETDYRFPIWVHEIHFGQGAEDEDKEEETKAKKTYLNLKAKMFDMLNEDLFKHLDLPYEEVYEDELTTLLYKFNRQGKMQMQSKEDYKKIMGFSPDHADSLALANWGRYCDNHYGSFEDIQAPESQHTHANNKRNFKEDSRRGRRLGREDC